MTKKLSEMTIEELWQLFPIILKEHNPHYKEWYEEEKNNLLSIIDQKYIERINHIGSTSVKNLIAKPTIDILLEITNDCETSHLTTLLEKNGWILMSKEHDKGLNLVFNKGYTPNGFAKKVFHLHIRHLSDWNELYFRDYLIDHPEISKDYEKLKLNLQKKYEHNRDGYTNAKTDFILKYTEKAREKYTKRY